MDGPRVRPEDRARERRILWTALVLTTIAFLGELGLGWWVAGSVALFSDAWHVAHHFAAIAIGLIAFSVSDRLGTKGAQARLEGRATVVVGVLLVLAAPIIFWQTWEQFVSPSEIQGDWMVVVAVGGLVLNWAVLRLLRRCPGLLMRGISLHTFWDLASSVVVVACSLLVVEAALPVADAVGGAVVGVGVLISGFHLGAEGLDHAQASRPPQAR